MMKTALPMGIWEIIDKLFQKQTALGARSRVFSPPARTCFRKRSHHYACGREHAGRMKSRRLKAAAPTKILRDRHAPW